MEAPTTDIAAKIDTAAKTDVIKMVMDKSKNSVMGAAIGAGIGFTGALIKGGDKMVFSFLGMLAGGLIGYFFNSKKEKE